MLKFAIIALVALAEVEARRGNRGNRGGRNNRNNRRQKYLNWVAKGKSLGSQSVSTNEFEKRMDCFNKNSDTVEEVNAAAEGKDEYALRLELNQFADLMPEELPLGHIYDGELDK